MPAWPSSARLVHATFTGLVWELIWSVPFVAGRRNQSVTQRCPRTARATLRYPPARRLPLVDLSCPSSDRATRRTNMFSTPPSGEETGLAFADAFVKETDSLREARKKRGVPVPTERPLEQDFVGLA